MPFVLTPDSAAAGCVEDGDAPWVIVTSKKKKRGHRPKAPNPVDFHNPSTAVPILGNTTAVVPPTSESAAGNGSVLATISHIQAEHARIIAWWREQPSYRQLVALISAQVSSHAPVTQALCLGAGSFGGPLDGGEAFRRAHIQTAAFLLIRDLLSQGDHPVPCYFQEPLYTAADKDYLHSLGHTVVEAPVATQMITTTSLVFAVHFPLREYVACLSGACPAMLVGTGYDACEQLPQFSTVDSTRCALQPLHDVHRSFDAYTFPQETQDYCFSDTVIYWCPYRADKQTADFIA